MVQRPRPPSSRHRPGAARPARPRRPLDHARALPPRRRRAGGPPIRAGAAGALPRLLFGLGLDRDRDRPQDGLPIPAPARRSARPPHLLRPPTRRLPRRHDRLGLGGRHRPLPRDLPAAFVRDPHRRAGRRGRPRADPCHARGRDRRGDRRAADPGRRRDARSPARIPVRRAPALRSVRRAADLR